MKQKLYQIQPPAFTDNVAAHYSTELAAIVDGPEEIVQVLMLDSPMPANPTLLVITNPAPPNERRKPDVETRG